MKMRALPDKILVVEMKHGLRKVGNIIIPDDDGKVHGIRPRWAKVWSKGKNVRGEFKEGDWLYIKHGRWSRAIRLTDDSGKEFYFWSVDPNGILLYSEEEPEDNLVGSSSECDFRKNLPGT